jgi:tritrans,polycis-undecaprenyl-diphosphate synthase [geranylgeranyl-diphosphate specific]
VSLLQEGCNETREQIGTHGTAMGISEKMGDVLGQAVEAKLFREVMEHDIQPKHLAIIMDGNRRFAWRSNLATHVGHRIGKQRLEAVLDWVLELGIPWFTVYALSTENLNRPKKELKTLFKLYIDGLKSIAEDPRIHENNVRVQIIGHRELLPQDVNDAIDYAESVTKDYQDFVFTVCLAYGAREEMIRAIQNIAELHAKGSLPLESITQETVSEHLYTAEMPDPDLVIRTSGEERISNFLLWQMAYSELYFTDVFWPSFKKRDLLKAVQTYQMRKRRFGE